jgi:thioredoxin-like negative regulator of GroEL
MPLLEISAEQAVANRKTNPLSGWGERNSPNRVEPIARPGFPVPFKLQPGEKIFTVGSCFARNVETELMKLGFQIPMRDLFKRSEFLNVEPGAINNFGTPSIWNEFAWAFGEAEFKVEEHILEVVGGKFADLHVIPSMRPESKDIVIARRSAIIEAFRTVAECRVLIMTLGLVEVWFDRKTGYYLNAAPRPSFVRNEPDRFVLRVLTYEEALDYLTRALNIIRKHSQPDLQILLTVSPVPLLATHRNEDVLVANMYSKSMLRTVAETIVFTQPGVTYYPSYESIVLSDRKLAWVDDLVHVTGYIVAMNVGRMIEAFVEAPADSSTLRAEIEAGGIHRALEKAQIIAAGPVLAAVDFFAEFGDWSAKSAEFAFEHAQFLLRQSDPAGALAVLDNAPEGGPHARRAALRAKALVGTGRPAEAFALLDPLAAPGSKSGVIWNGLMDAAMATGEGERVVSVLARWAQTSPSRISRPTLRVGRWFHERGDLVRAISFLEQAVMLNPKDASSVIFMVEALLADGRAVEARAALDLARPEAPGDIKRAERLRHLLGS